VGQKNARLSIDTLSTLLESGEDVLYIFHMIIRQFRLLLQIKYLLTQGNNQKNIQTTLKQHPYVVMTTMRQCRNFDLETLKKMYQNLLELDIDTKTGKTRIITGDSRQFNLALEKFIREHCK
jgi:DNA polymerase-3 subunit delta